MSSVDTGNEESEYVVGKEYSFSCFTVGCMEGYENATLTAWEKFAKDFQENEHNIACRFYDMLKDVVRLNGYTHILKNMAKSFLIVKGSKRACSLLHESKIEWDDSQPLVVRISWKGLSKITPFDMKILSNIATNMLRVISCNDMFAATVVFQRITFEACLRNKFALADVSELESE